MNILRSGLTHKFPCRKGILWVKPEREDVHVLEGEVKINDLHLPMARAITCIRKKGDTDGRIQLYLSSDGKINVDKYFLDDSLHNTWIWEVAMEKDSNTIKIKGEAGAPFFNSAKMHDARGWMEGESYWITLTKSQELKSLNYLFQLTGHLHHSTAESGQRVGLTLLPVVFFFASIFTHWVLKIKY